MKNKGFTIDHVKKEIIVTKSFLARASQLDTQEFDTVQNLMMILSDYKFVKRDSIKKNPNKRTYRNLTYKNMEKYIKLMDGSSALQEFEKVKKASSIVPSPYAYVKKWFLKTYPDYLEIVEEEAGEEAIQQAMTYRKQSEASFATDEVTAEPEIERSVA